MTVLVTSASKHGATAEIAEAIAGTLREEGLETEVLPVDEVETLGDYEAFVVGSAVYMGHWLEPARTFVETHAHRLRARPTWLFSSGPIGDPPRPRTEDAVDVSRELESSGAEEHRLLGGKIDKSQLGFAERAVLRAVGAAEGDYRDWDEVEAWARGIAKALLRSAATVPTSR